MAEYETVRYEQSGGVAWITLDRPEVLNAFNNKMQDELHHIWRTLRHDGDVRCAVLTGAGERAFCTGVDRNETAADTDAALGLPFHWDDPGDKIGPKSSGLWKPVVAAINGIACGGAFYMLGEVDVVIAAEHATFFDPHVTYGMTASFESMHILQRMPLGEVLRMQLLGAHERVSAQRAYQVGLVSEVVPAADLHVAADRVARIIAEAPPLVVEATLRATWSARDLGRRQALDAGYAYVALGNTEAALAEGQQRFAAGERVEWRLR